MSLVTWNFGAPCATCLDASRTGAYMNSGRNLRNSGMFCHCFGVYDRKSSRLFFFFFLLLLKTWVNIPLLSTVCFFLFVLQFPATRVSYRLGKKAPIGCWKPRVQVDSRLKILGRVHVWPWHSLHGVCTLPPS